MWIWTGRYVLSGARNCTEGVTNYNLHWSYISKKEVEKREGEKHAKKEVREERKKRHAKNRSGARGQRKTSLKNISYFNALFCSSKKKNPTNKSPNRRISCSRVLPEMMLVTQWVKKLSHFVKLVISKHSTIGTFPERVSAHQLMLFNKNFYILFFTWLRSCKEHSF